MEQAVRTLGTISFLFRGSIGVSNSEKERRGSRMSISQSWWTGVRGGGSPAASAVAPNRAIRQLLKREKQRDCRTLLRRERP